MVRNKWKLIPIENLVKLCDTGVWGPEANIHEGVGVLRSTNFTNSGELDFSEVAYRRIALKKVQEKRLCKGDILLERSGGGPKQPVGRVVYFDSDEAYVFGNFIQRLRAREDICIPKFLFYTLYWLHQSGKTQQLQQQTTGIRNLNFKEYMSTKLPIPPLSEQRKIAAILTSVDDAIAATQRIIDQTERVKRGLMQQLLTRGIGHTKFKKTEVGEIPVEWDVAPIGDVCQTTSGGTPKRSVKSYYENGTIPWIKTGELGIKYIFDSEEKITDEAVKKSSAKILPRNTVLVAMYGATIGKSSILKIEAATNQACCAVLCDEQKVHHEFLYYILSFRKDELVNLGAGGAQPNISQQLIKGFSIPIPPIAEQRQIAAILASIDDKLEHEYKTLQMYSSLKVSLMNVLLTGKVRVKVDEEAEAVV